MERDGVVAVQTPQAFRAEVLRRAHASADDATDDAGLVEALGATVRVVAGEPRNIKVTTAADLELVQLIAEDRRDRRHERRGDSGRPGIRRPPLLRRPRPSPRARWGEIPAAAGLDGHSDADVVCHALADALLGAAGLGDLGRHFPATDPKWAGARLHGSARRGVSMLGEQGLVASNADCTVVCERPRLAEHTAAMMSRLSALLGAPVSVKAKRAEGLGAIGRVEGIACLAVALVTQP